MWQLYLKMSAAASQKFAAEFHIDVYPCHLSGTCSDIPCQITLTTHLFKNNMNITIIIFNKQIFVNYRKSLSYAHRIWDDLLNQIT